MCARSLTDNSRATIVGKVVDIHSREFEGGKKRVQMDIEDSTGFITAKAWDEAYEVFKGLTPGGTYKFVNVQIKQNTQPNKSCLEVKLYRDTPVELHADINIPYKSSVDIQVGQPAHLRAVLSSVDGADGESRRCNLVDQHGDITAFIKSDSTVNMNDFEVGDIVEVDGKTSFDDREKIFMHTIRKSQDDELSAFWLSQKDTYVAKRPKFDVKSVKKLCDLKEIPPQTRCEVRGIVRSCSLNPIPQTNARGGSGERVKHTLTIVDDSNVAIMVGVFCDKTTPFSVKIGDAISLNGTVSAYSGISLTCNAVTPVDDAELASWWKTGPDDFEELSAA